MSAKGGRHWIVKCGTELLRLSAAVFALVSLPLVAADAQSERGAVPSFPVTGMDSTFARLAREAVTALEAERYGEAVQKATAALARKPDNESAATVYRWRGVAYDNLGDTDRALADYSSAIQAYPAVKWVHGYRGVLYRRRGEYAKAIVDLTVALRDQDSRAYVYSSRARAYELFGDKAAARRDYEQAIASAGNASAALSARADAYAALGRYKEAAAHHAAAKRVAPLD
ncbi:MAG TPA: tetratricopeptide repeat protein, partial [Chthoniobacterales bacterium]|nr:tetratricopeptide repeat protein [Chthoniobacterales bacterium]